MRQLRKGHETVVRLLLNRGAEANAITGYSGGKAVLWLAALKGHETVVELLRNRGAGYQPESRL